MNIVKNMEAIFIVAVTLAFTAAFATAAPLANTEASAHIPSITITAKHMTAAEKADLSN